MPKVNGKEYPYTKEGKAAAEKARKKKMYGGMAKKRNTYKDGGMSKAKPC